MDFLQDTAPVALVSTLGERGAGGYAIPPLFLGISKWRWIEDIFLSISSGGMSSQIDSDCSPEGWPDSGKPVWPPHLFYVLEPPGIGEGIWVLSHPMSNVVMDK